MIIENFYSRESAKSLKCSKKRFYMAVYNSSCKRGFNKRILLYSLKRNGRPVNLGNVHADTAGYPGEAAMANLLLKKLFGYKTTCRTGYELVRKDITIFEI